MKLSKSEPLLRFNLPSATVDGDTTKSVEWSYPTSTNAKRFGFHDSGCWTVQLCFTMFPPKAIAGYASRDAAIDHAKTLNHDWNSCWLQYNQKPD